MTGSYRHIFAFFILLWARVCFAPPDVVIAVFDSPADYFHPQIASNLEFDRQQEAFTRDAFGHSTSWFDLNQAAMRSLESQLGGSEPLSEQIRYLDNHYRLTSSLLDQETRSLIRGEMRPFEQRVPLALLMEDMNRLSYYLHGTNVTGIATRDLSNTGVMHYPWMTAQTLDDPWNIRFFESGPREQRELLRQRFADLTRVLHENNVRVVNFSAGYGTESLQNTWKGLAARNGEGPATTARNLYAATTFSNLNYSMWQEFLRANPNTIFVMAAGNDGRETDAREKNTLTLKAPNLIRVAALNEMGNLPKWASYHSNLVDIGANGVAVEGPAPGGETVHMSGSSQAAPAVTNALARILEKNPSLNANEAINELWKQSRTDTSLGSVIADGKILNVDTKNQMLSPDTRQLRIELANLSSDGLRAFSREHVKRVQESRVPTEITFTQEGHPRVSSIITPEAMGGVRIVTRPIPERPNPVESPELICERAQAALSGKRRSPPLILEGSFVQ